MSKPKSTTGAPPKRRGPSKAEKENASLRDRLKKANAKSRGMREHAATRKVMDGVEVMGGAVLAGAVHGAGLSFNWRGRKVPIGAAIGPLTIGAGVVFEQDDLQAVGLGMSAYSFGRVVEGEIERRRTVKAAA